MDSLGVTTTVTVSHSHSSTYRDSSSFLRTIVTKTEDDDFGHEEVWSPVPIRPRLGKVSHLVRKVNTQWNVRSPCVGKKNSLTYRKGRQK